MLAAPFVHVLAPPVDIVVGPSVYAYTPLAWRYACPERDAEARTAESTGRRLITVDNPDVPQTSPMATGMRSVTDDAVAATTPLPVSTMRASDIKRLIGARDTARASSRLAWRSARRACDVNVRRIDRPTMPSSVMATRSSTRLTPERRRE